MSAPADPGFAVYLHWPWCAAKCPYCDFNSHVSHRPLDQERYAAAVAREIATTAGKAPGRTVSSIFLGGGTPSLMEPRTVAAVLDAVASAWTVAGDAEVTLEANPSSVEASRFEGYRAAGVNRVSVGVQALDDASLRFLGRLHNAEEARRALDTANRSFDRVSFDMIYARPGQSAEAWGAELTEALSLAGEHVSLYQLTIEPDTPFAALHAAGKFAIPDEEAAVALYRVTQELTAARGLPAYEISNHARPGSECRHNLVYWRYGEYAGIGPGAHGRLVLADGRHAVSTVRDPKAWLERVESWGDGIDSDELLILEEAGDEFLLMGLRLSEGIDRERYRQIAGRSLDPVRVADLIAHGMVEAFGERRLRATRAGAEVLDAVVADLAA